MEWFISHIKNKIMFVKRRDYCLTHHLNIQIDNSVYVSFFCSTAIRLCSNIWLSAGIHFRVGWKNSTKQLSDVQQFVSITNRSIVEVKGCQYDCTWFDYYLIRLEMLSLKDNVYMQICRLSKQLKLITIPRLFFFVIYNDIKRNKLELSIILMIGHF